VADRRHATIFDHDPNDYRGLPKLQIVSSGRLPLSIPRINFRSKAFANKELLILRERKVQALHSFPCTYDGGGRESSTDGNVSPCDEVRVGSGGDNFGIFYYGWQASEIGYAEINHRTFPFAVKMGDFAYSEGKDVRPLQIGHGFNGYTGGSPSGLCPSFGSVSGYCSEDKRSDNSKGACDPDEKRCHSPFSLAVSCIRRLLGDLKRAPLHTQIVLFGTLGLVAGIGVSEGARRWFLNDHGWWRWALSGLACYCGAVGLDLLMVFCGRGAS
jgi:hypothetical protein